jgi:hypothetical protein
MMAYIIALHRLQLLSICHVTGGQSKINVRSGSIHVVKIGRVLKSISYIGFICCNVYNKWI